MIKHLLALLTALTLTCLSPGLLAAKGGEKGPGDRAYEHASDNASFKRDGKHKDEDHKKKDKKKKHKNHDDDRDKNKKKKHDRENDREDNSDDRKKGKRSSND